MLRVFLMERICYRYLMPKFRSRNSAETKAFARRTIQKLIASGHRPLIIALSGELGSGKTTFMRGLARALGIRAKLQSPTFVLAKWYRLARAEKISSYRRLIHVDAYRLDSVVDARHIGLDTAFGDADAIVVIEWADRILRLIPKTAIWVGFHHGHKPSERIIEVKKLIK